MSKIRLGIVGPGLIWEREHKPALNQLKELYDFSAFSASSEKSKKKVEQEFPGVPFFQDYREMIKSPDVDAVVVLTPISLNAAVAVDALVAKKDVIMEKPIAADSKQARKLVEAEKSSGNKVLILEQNVFMQKTDEYKKIVESNTLGDLIFFDLLWHQFLCEEDNELSYGNVEWRRKPDFQLGTLYDSGIHEISMMSKIFGKPDSVYAACTADYRPEYGNMEQVSAIFEYGKFLKGFYSHSSFLPDKMNYFNLRGSEGMAYMQEDRIVVEKNNGDMEEKDISDNNIHYKMWKRMHDIVTGKQGNIYTTNESLNDILILEAIGQSLEKSCKIEIRY